MLTIFTPTFNRAGYLYKCYESLKNQSYKDFEWLIIDDGSTDETEEVVQAFIDEGQVSIRYCYQENAGKQAAWNHAVKEAIGQYFIGVDSDDALVPESLSVFFTSYVPKIDFDPLCIGIRALSLSSTQDRAYESGFLADKETSMCSWFDEFGSKIAQERIDIFKTDILKAYLYPVSTKIKFIPEIWLYVNISQSYHFLYVNKCLRIFYDDHEQNRLSRSSLQKHARGHYLSRMAMLRCIPIRFFMKNPLAFFKTLVRAMQAKIYILLKSK